MGEDTIWRNGHGFRHESDNDWSTWEGEQLVRHPYIACVKCGTRADSPMSQRKCLGFNVYFMRGIDTLRLEPEVTPKGRKPIKVEVDLNIDAILELAEFLRATPSEHRGHAYWHYGRPDAPYPCAECHGDLGAPARRLEAAKKGALDADFREESKALQPGEGA